MKVKEFIKTKSDSISVVVVIVLVVIAIGLGIAIVHQGNFATFLSTFPIKINQPKITITPKSNSPITPNARPRRPYPLNLTEEETALMHPPARDASQEVKAAHFALAKKLAVEADVLELNKCDKPFPLDMVLKKDQAFKIHNNDTIKHTIVIDSNHTFEVEPNSTKEFKANFGHGLGIYGYLCDDLAGVVGFWYVIK